jgi:hypothetical protein
LEVSRAGRRDARRVSNAGPRRPPLAAAVRLSRGLLAIHVASVPDCDQDDDETVILDRVDHSIVTDSDPPGGPAGQRP